MAPELSQLPSKPSPRTRLDTDLRARLLAAAIRVLEASGPEALQARKLTAEVGASTQAIYTLFGGMSGLFEAIVAEGFRRFGSHVDGVPETEDPVADHLAKGWAFCDWALAHPNLYRLMMGLTGGEMRLRPGLEMTLTGAVAMLPEGRAALAVLQRSVERMKQSGRIDADPLLAAGQFLSATHGFVMLQVAGVFGEADLGLQVMGSLAINLLVGLGDTREAAERSLLAAAVAHEGSEGSSRAP